MAWAQIAVEINGVNKNCDTAARLARKQQLRGNLLQSRLRSDSTMQQNQGSSPTQKIYGRDSRAPRYKRNVDM